MQKNEKNSTKGINFYFVKEIEKIKKQKLIETIDIHAI